jgi:hypothetical protein
MKKNIRVETQMLERNVTALSAALKKNAAEVVRDVAVMVLQSGANVIPQTKKANRDVVKMVRRYRHGVEELVRGGRVEAPGDRMLYLIARPPHRKPISRSGDRRWWTFESEEAAREHRAITFRGVAKAGFWSQFPALGRPVPGKYSSTAFLADLPGLSSTTGSLNSSTPVINLVNRSKAIRDKNWKKGLILSKVNNRIAGMVRGRADRLARFRAAGGLAWTMQESDYE